jgi:AcrR family transcriptional regulator
MNITGNVRYQFTEEIIEKAVFSLLKRRKYDSFTIKEICAEAGVNRSSFYAHFEDINDLMMKIESKLAKNIDLIFKPGDAYDRQAFIALFTFVRENKAFYKAFLRGNVGVFVESDMIKKIKPAFTRIALDRKYRYTEAEIEYHMCFFAAGLKIVCAKWLEHDCKETPEQMSQIIVDEYANNAKYVP